MQQIPITIILSAILAALTWINVLCQPDGIAYPIVRIWKTYIGANKLSFMLFECAKCNSFWWFIAFLLMPSVLVFWITCGCMVIYGTYLVDKIVVKWL